MSPRGIAIDATPAMKPIPTGVARYVRRLVEAFATVATADQRFLLAHRISRFRRRAWRIPLPDGRFRRRWIPSLLPLRARIAHGPDARILEAGRAAMVVTVHDCFALEDDADGRPAWREKMRRRYADTAARADLVITPSIWTRDRFLAHHPAADPDRVRVIPHGVDPAFRPGAIQGLAALRARVRLPASYALFLGALVARKNPAALVEAWRHLGPDAPDLVLAGPGGSERERVDAAVAASDLGDRVQRLGPIPDTDLPALVAGAHCLLLPSRREGFGLPVLEAQASGVPVIHSGLAALPEASGEAALIGDPGAPETIAFAVDRLRSDPGLRERLRDAGLAWAARFTWEETARRTLTAYAEVTARA